MSRRDTRRDRAGTPAGRVVTERPDPGTRPAAHTPTAAPRHPWWPVAASAALAALLYARMLPWGFVWDDHRLIEDDPYLRSWPGVRQLLAGDFWMMTGHAATGLWRPVVMASYAVDGAVSHFTPGWFRAMNLLAHAGCSALVAALALMGGVPAWGAALAGAWFAAMPAHVESVAWISGRTDVYCAALFLGALALDQRARARGRGWPGSGACVLLVLALLAKETAVTFAGVVAVEEVVARRRWQEAARWLAPYVTVTAAYLVVHAIVVRAPELPASLDADTVRRGMWAVPTFLTGYLHFLWPIFPHSPGVTVRLPEGPLDRAVLAGLALHVLLIGVLVVWLVRRERLATPMTLFGAGLAAPALATLLQSNLLYAERFVYLPSAGVAWLIGDLAARPRPRVPRLTALAALATMVVASAWVTVRTLPDWSSDEALFRSMTVKQPRNVMGRIEWARRLAARGDEAAATRELDEAAALDSSRAGLWSVRALIPYRHGDWPSVLRLSAHALTLDSLMLEPRIERATALLRMGRRAEAESEIARLRADVPGDAAVEALWGEWLAMQGRAAEAEPLLTDAARRAPDDADLAFALGMARARLGRLADARVQFERALALDPNFYQAWLRLALAAHLLGDSAARDQALTRAATLPDARDGEVGVLRARMGLAGR